MNKTTISVIVVLICVLVSPLMADIHYHTCPKIIINLNDIKFRTGDLILCRWMENNIVNQDHATGEKTVRYENLIMPELEKLFSSLLLSYYTHIGIVMVINDIPYIYELTNNITSTKYPTYDEWTKRHINKTPALYNIKYIKKYPGHIYHTSYTGPTIPENRVIKTLNKLANTNFDIYHIILYNCTSGIFGNDPKRHICTSFVAIVLAELRIVNTTKDRGITPSHILDECVKSGKYTHISKLINVTYEKNY